MNHKTAFKLIKLGSMLLSIYHCLPQCLVCATLVRSGMAALPLLQLLVCRYLPSSGFLGREPFHTPLRCPYAVGQPQVHFPPASRSGAGRGRTDNGDPCSTLKSAPVSGLNAFNWNCTIRMDLKTEHWLTIYSAINQ